MVVLFQATPRLHDSRRIISELADRNLDGKFPEEEMQIMAYLAKECLLLDPEARPTMGEVVQILSTIAPKRSRRANISINFSQVIRYFFNFHKLHGLDGDTCINKTGSTFACSSNFQQIVWSFFPSL